MKYLRQSWHCTPRRQSIRQAKNIEDIKQGGQEHKIGLYADDIVLLLKNPVKSLQEAQNVIRDFSKVSYYKVNEDNSVILGGAILSIKSLEQLFPYKWAKDVIKYLGIRLSGNVATLSHHNYKPWLTKCRRNF